MPFAHSSASPRRRTGAVANLHAIEESLHAHGYELIAGIDEAGRGPLAGPVCTAAVVFEPGTRIPGVNDSKQLKPAERDALYDLIIAKAAAVGVGLADVDEIDSINILNATKLAARRAIRQLTVLPDYLLVDALELEEVTIPQDGIVKGDARCFSIAAASIVAKVTRDRLMERYDGEYPQYNFARHKGYGTEEHLRAIAREGISTIHRQSFCDFGFLPPVLDEESAAPSGRPLVTSRTFQRLGAELRRAGRMESLDAIGGEINRLHGFLPPSETTRLWHAISRRVERLGRAALGVASAPPGA
jgi:ribonuclease HII